MTWQVALRALVAAVVAAMVLGVMLVSAAVGAATPGLVTLRDVPRLASFATPDVDAGELATLRREYLEEVLGPDSGALLGERGEGTGGRRAPGGDGTAVPRTASGTTTTTTTTTTVPPRRGGDIIPALPTEADWDVAMAADRRTVAPGEEIRYAITITNVGGRAFTGDVEIRSHIPFGTTEVAEPCAGVGETPVRGCLPEVPGSPGVPSDGVHQVNVSYSFVRAEPGRQETVHFRVRVNETTRPGSEITNHAHVMVVGSDEPRDTSETVVVRVV